MRHVIPALGFLVASASLRSLGSIPVGSFSDNFRHRLGRRHPLMLAAVVPFALSIYALFAPRVTVREGGVLGVGAWIVLFTSPRACA